MLRPKLVGYSQFENGQALLSLSATRFLELISCWDGSDIADLKLLLFEQIEVFFGSKDVNSNNLRDFGFENPPDCFSSVNEIFDWIELRLFSSLNGYTYHPLAFFDHLFQCSFPEKVAFISLDQCSLEVPDLPQRLKFAQVSKTESYPGPKEEDIYDWQFHGTCLSFAEEVCTNNFSARWKGNLQFGNGFYTTESWEIAERYARSHYNCAPKDDPSVDLKIYYSVILAFKVPKDSWIEDNSAKLWDRLSQDPSSLIHRQIASIKNEEFRKLIRSVKLGKSLPHDQIFVYKNKKVSGKFDQREQVDILSGPIESNFVEKEDNSLQFCFRTDRSRRFIIEECLDSMILLEPTQ